MRVLLVSDLHLDYRVLSVGTPGGLDPLLIPLSPDGTTLNPADVVVVAGDSLNGVTNGVFTKFLRAVRQYYPLVLVILGNHEYYNKADMAQIERDFHSVCAKVPGVIPLVNQTVYLISPTGQTVAFHGTTLWTALDPPPEEKINDFCRIHIRDPGVKTARCWTPAESQAQFHTNVAWLDQAVAEATTQGFRSVIITHHAPLTVNTYAPEYNNSANLSNFVSDLSWFMTKHRNVLKTWCFGHTHYMCDFTYDQTRVVSNPLGYQKEQTGYKPGFVFEV